MSSDNDEHLDLLFIERLVAEYKGAKALADTTRERSDKMKKQLSEIVDTHGYVDHNGHRWLDVGEFKLKRERRVGKSFDAAACEVWAKKEGLWDNVSEVVEALSEDKVLALAWDDPEIRDEIEGFYIERETWAFKV